MGIFCLQISLGLEKNKNTELACIHLIDRILPAFLDGSYCLCVFLDFSACFDTISRSILFDKLARYGLLGASLDFIKSYFSNRNQYVLYSGVKSGYVSQNLGTIQGSKNGPRFFDIYSNDMNFLLNDNQNILYADDTTIVYVHKDLATLTSYVNERLSILYDWCCFNKMVINPAKSEYLLLTNRPVAVYPVISLGGDIIERVGTSKYLGIHLDDKLKYHDQIAHVKSKLRQFRGVSHRISRFIDKKSAKKVYYSMVYSAVSYCIIVWGGIFCYTRRGEELQRLQTAIVRNLFYHFSSNNECIYRANSILKLIDIYKLYVSIYMYKLLKLDLYPTLADDLNLGTNDHIHNTRNRNNLVPPFPRVESIRLSYKYMFPTVWNEIPIHLRDARSLSLFKRGLIQYFLNQY